MTNQKSNSDGGGEQRFSQEQYDMLKRCSEKRDMTEWNQWRKEHNDEEILLEGAHLEGAHLGGVPDDGGPFEDAPREGAHLEGAELEGAHLEGAYLCIAHLEHAGLNGAHLEGANLISAYLEDAGLTGVHLEDANLYGAHLEVAILWRAHLENADLRVAHLEGAILWTAHLEGANLTGAYLQDADFSRAMVNGRTLVWNCQVNRKTKFHGVGLGTIRVNPQEKQLLEYNIRRMNWEEWYPKQHWLLRCVVRNFWQISDYGISTKQIIRTFFKWALAFAAVYYVWGLIDYYFMCLKDYPGIVSDLFVLEDNQQGVSCWLVPFRAVYFSIVTMTTLGFGDMYANAHSFVRGLFGHGLLALQVILGYVLLGALVTRFAVLFTAGGPAGKFSQTRRERHKSCPKLKVGWDELVRDKAILQTGDVIHVQSRGIISRLVRFFSKADEEEPSWASHSAMVLRVGEEIEIIEALWRTLIRPITAYEGKRAKLLACRKPGGIEEEQKQKMIEKAEYYKGKMYGFWEITFHVLDRLLNNSYVFRRLIKDNDYPICSWLVAYVYDRVLGYRFGAPPNAAQPDDLLDHCIDYDWEFIWADSSQSVADFCRTYKLSDEDDSVKRT